MELDAKILQLRPSSSSAFVVPAIRRSTLGDRSFSAAGPGPGIVCRPLSPQRLLCHHSVDTWNPICSQSRFHHDDDFLLADLTRCDCVKCPCSFQLCHFNQFFFLHYITLQLVLSHNDKNSTEKFSDRDHDRISTKTEWFVARHPQKIS